MRSQREVQRSARATLPKEVGKSSVPTLLYRVGYTSTLRVTGDEVKCLLFF